MTTVSKLATFQGPAPAEVPFSATLLVRDTCLCLHVQRAARALDEVPVELREISSVTFAVASSRLEEAKDLIVAFRRRLSRILTSERPDTVYTFATQLFPALAAASPPSEAPVREKPRKKKKESRP